MLFYQRAGQDKDAAHAGAGWADGASHVGPLQDHDSRLFSDKNNAATARDLWGGWYAAGDYNKYTSWTASYVEGLLRAYLEIPGIWTDDYGIPESGNGVPDVIDEARWGLDFLTRMQGGDGSVLSSVGEVSASPPSAATGQSLYGPASTSASLATAAAFAMAARVLPKVDAKNAALASAAADALARARMAWTWADQHPSVIFKNNDSGSGSQGLGSGQQETDDYGRLVDKLDAAAQLVAASGDAAFQTFFDGSYTQLHLFTQNSWVAPWYMQGQDAALDYADAAGASPAVAKAIRDAYLTGAKSSGNLGAITANQDPYLAYMKDYVWGSNSPKANIGNLFAAVIAHGLDTSMNADMARAAARYAHSLHGTIPLSLVYLTNMYQHGAENCANELFHTWFADGSAKWDRVGTSQYGPPPGYLTGGPNPSYTWDSCCPSGCGSAANNALCTSMSLMPPQGQPPQKSYKDFTAGWPLDSWRVTDPDDGDQIAYIRLLSKLVRCPRGLAAAQAQAQDRRDVDHHFAGRDGGAGLQARRRADDEDEGLLVADAGLDQIAGRRAVRDRQVVGIGERGPGGDGRDLVDHDDAGVRRGLAAGGADVDVDLGNGERGRVGGEAVLDVQHAHGRDGAAAHRAGEAVILQDDNRGRRRGVRLGVAKVLGAVASEGDADLAGIVVQRRALAGPAHRRSGPGARGGGNGAGRVAEVDGVALVGQRDADVEGVGVEPGQRARGRQSERDGAYGLEPGSAGKRGH